MPLPFRRSRLNGSTSGQKFGTTIEKEELEKSICDDEDESQTPNLKKKPKLSLNDQYPLNEARTPIAIKGWNTCSTGFCSKSISKSAKPKLKNNISKTQRTKVVVKKVLNDSEYIVNDDGSNSMVIPESPDSIPKKNESPDSTPKKNLDLSQTILTPNTPDSNDRKDDRGTKWIQQITWKPKTPQKTKPDFTSLIDSGKKRKPIKGGFAENLRKLQVREKSSKAIWQLEKTKSMKKGHKSN